MAENTTDRKKITNSKPIPHILLPFNEPIANVLEVKPPDKGLKAHESHKKTQV